MIVPVCIHSFKYSYAHYSLMMMAFDNYLGWYLSLVVFGIIISALEFVPYDHASLDGKSDDDQIVDAVYLLPQLYVTIGLSIPLVANYIADIVSSLSKHSKTSNQEKFMFITRSFLYSTIIAQSVLLLISDEELKTTYVVFLYRIQRYLLMSTCVSCLYGLEPYQKLIKFSTFVLQCILLLSQILLTLTHFVDGSAERIGLLYFSFSLNIIVTAVTFGFGFYLIKSLVNQLIQHKSLLFLSRHQILYSGYLFIMFLDAAFWLDLYNSANGDQMQLLGIFSGKVDSTYNDFALCLLVFAVIIVVLEILTIKFDDFNTKVYINSYV